MNSLSYYTRQKEVWTNEELEQLRNEYQTQEMTVSKIGDIHKRTPGSISYKLKGMNIVENNTKVRGYSEYKESELYKEIVSSGKDTRAEKKRENKEVKVVATKINSEEFLELKKEISGLKEKVDEILRLMNAVYEFQTVEE
jgi:alpha-galactosidase/6-phospho-beta-glucosidase family protein